MGDAWLGTVADGRQRAHRWLGCRETCLQVILKTLKWLATNETQAHTLLVLSIGLLRARSEKASYSQTSQVYIHCCIVSLLLAVAPIVT